jgi:RNA polymerase sigma-70 factor (ECF subfamily)
MDDSSIDVKELGRGTGPSAADSDAVDATLAASGDAQAFERLYRGHAARIHGLVRRMLGGEHTDEVTQDVFVRAWEKLGTFRGEAAFGTWLHRVAVNVILGRRQTLGIARGRFTDTDESLDRMSTPRAHSDFYVDFDTAIEQLPQGARQVFVLHDVEGYKHHEVAEMLGVTTGTSKAQLHRARMALRRHLDR